MIRVHCRAAGFTVRTWDATENGDDHDSFYWCHRDRATTQSQGTFPTPADAWLDCCSTVGLLDAYAASAAAAGCVLNRPSGFVSWFWHDAQGAAHGPFAHPLEALTSCILANDLGPEAPVAVPSPGP